MIACDGEPGYITVNVLTFFDYPIRKLIGVESEPTDKRPDASVKGADSFGNLSDESEPVH